MTELSSGRVHRHQLVTAAHDFLLAVLPFRHPDSGQALARFLGAAAHAGTSVSEPVLVLTDVLAVLNARARRPALLDGYVAARRHSAEPIARFRTVAKTSSAGAPSATGTSSEP